MIWMDGQYFEYCLKVLNELRAKKLKYKDRIPFLEKKWKYVKQQVTTR